MKKIYVDFDEKKVKESDGMKRSFEEVGIIADAPLEEIREHLRESLFPETEIIFQYGRYYDRLMEENCEYLQDSEVLKELMMWRKSEIVRFAYENWTEQTSSGVVFITPNDELSANSENAIFLYELKSNWLSQNCWNDHLMLVTDEEWEKLQEKYGEEADFTDRSQVESIGIDFDERCIDYLVSYED